MTVAQWISLPSCQTIQESDLATTNLWIGHQGITGIAKFQIQSTHSEVVLNVELADNDTDHLEIQVSPDLLRLSGIRYESIPSNTPDDAETDASEQFYQPRLFRDLIPLPQAVVLKNHASGAGGNRAPFPSQFMQPADQTPHSFCASPRPGLDVGPAGS
jgi:hypothetical protein